MNSYEWHQHFIRLCLEHASMSKDPNTQVGAVIIGENWTPRSDGFNGFPRGIADALDRLSDRDTKNELMVHAEMNALMNACRSGISTLGATMYLACTDDSGETWGGSPCEQCTIHIIQAGISQIVTLPWKDGPSRWTQDIELSKQLLKEAGVDILTIVSGAQ